MIKYGAPIDIEIKDLDIKKRMIKAYYSNYETIDSDGDVIMKGAYTKSIQERGPGSVKPRIKHLFNHWDGVGEVKELGEDDTGGWFLSKMGRHTNGRDTLLMYEDGIITEHSHGFETINSSPGTKDGKDVNIITEGVLWETTSLDKWGANMNTPVIKSKEHQTYWVKRIDKLNKALRDGYYTDETFELLELQLKQIQKLLRDFKPGVQSTRKEPEQTTHLKELPININQIKF